MASEPKIVGTLTIDVTDTHGLNIRSVGEVIPQDIFVACAFLTRTANQLLDAAAYQAAQATDPNGIAVVQAIPDALKARQ